MKNEDAYVLREGDAVKRFLLILFIRTQNHSTNFR